MAEDNELHSMLPVNSEVEGDDENTPEKARIIFSRALTLSEILTCHKDTQILEPATLASRKISRNEVHVPEILDQSRARQIVVERV